MHSTIEATFARGEFQHEKNVLLAHIAAISDKLNLQNSEKMKLSFPTQFVWDAFVPAGLYHQWVLPFYLPELCTSSWLIALDVSFFFYSIQVKFM